MSDRPSRAKMCNWLSRALYEVRVSPSNPADIQRAGELRKIAESKLQDLAQIAGELGWHADASLDFAWELIEEYNDRYNRDGSHL